MKTNPARLMACSLLLLLTACTKAIDGLTKKEEPGNAFVHHRIARGSHSSDHSTYSAGKFTQINFLAKFDSSALYETMDPSNQFDINKLYGFADNNKHHHEFSARIGWRWSDGALRLFGYVYNDGTLASREITTVSIGSEIDCSIRVEGEKYFFTANGTTISMPRLAEGTVAVGYRLYPYFGGDETAPHDIHIWIKEK